MNYSCEEEYNEYMGFQAEQEAQAYYDMEQEYQRYLDELIESKQFYLYSLEICGYLLMSGSFSKSGLTAQEYISIKKEEYINQFNIKEENKENNF